MGRKLRLRNVARLTIPPSRCVVANCTDQPRDGALVCLIHARALAHLAQKEADR